MATPSTVRPPKQSGARQASARVSAARKRRQRQLLVRSAVVGILILGALLLISRGEGGGAGPGDSNAAEGPPFSVGRPGPGQVAPPIQLASTAGGKFDLADQSGKRVLVYFHEGLGCQPCWDQIKDIEKDMPAFKALGIDSVVAIAGNPLDDLRRKASDDGIKTPVLADPTLSLGKTYNANQFGMMGTSAYGHSFIVVDPDGTIAWRADYGGAPEYSMYVKNEALLQDLRQGIGDDATKS